jgi:hypothetical protein
MVYACMCGCIKCKEWYRSRTFSQKKNIAVFNHLLYLFYIWPDDGFRRESKHIAYTVWLVMLTEALSPYLIFMLYAMGDRNRDNLY